MLSIDTTLERIEQVEMARNDEGNARKCVSDYARPVLERPVTRIHAPLNRGANFRIDSHVMSMLMDIMWPISQSHFHVSFLCSLK